MKNAPVSVLIPTMNRPDTLAETLEAYFSCEVVPSQFVIVDQSQDLDTQAKIRSIVSEHSGDAECIYIYQKEPSSTVARNVAMSLASNDILLFSDDDISVYEDTVRNLFSLMESDRHIAMIAGIDDNTPISKGIASCLMGQKSFFHRHIGHVTKSMLGVFPDEYKEETKTTWAMGFFFAVRKSLLAEWQISWDEKLKSYAYGEDLDFTYQYYKAAHKTKMKCIFSNQVRVLHKGSLEYRVPKKKTTMMFVLNRYYLAHKNKLGPFASFAMWYTNVWILFLRKKDNAQGAKDMQEAMTLLRKNRAKIKKGIFPYNEIN